MYELKKMERYLRVGTGPSSCEKIIYRAAVSQMVRNTAAEYLENSLPQSDFTSRRKLRCEKFQLEITRLFVVAIKSAMFLSERRQSTEKYE